MICSSVRRSSAAFAGIIKRNLGNRWSQHVAGTAPLGPKINHHRLTVTGRQHFRFKISIRHCLDIVSHIVCSQQLGARPLFRSPLSPQLDVVTDIWFLPACLAPRTVSAASYTFAYSAAGAFQEKSLAIPFNWMRFQMRSSVQ